MMSIASYFAGVNYEAVGAAVGGALTAVVAMGLSFQKAKKSWATTSAETSVISLLHVEVERLAAQNLTLARHLYDMQAQIIQLRTENQGLELQIVRLKERLNFRERATDTDEPIGDES